ERVHRVSSRLYRGAAQSAVKSCGTLSSRARFRPVRWTRPYAGSKYERVTRTRALAGTVAMVLGLAACRRSHDPSPTGTAAAAPRTTPAPAQGAPPEAATCPPEGAPSAQRVSCEGWMGTAGVTSCRYAWMRCSDGHDREIRCEITDRGYDCMCIRAA